MTSQRQRLSYEGEIYVRPIGRGIILDDEPGEPYLDDWIETWLTEDGSSSFMSGFSTRIRIVVERVDEHESYMRADDDIAPVQARSID
jgi:hypothetical protein